MVDYYDFKDGDELSDMTRWSSVRFYYNCFKLIAKNQTFNPLQEASDRNILEPNERKHAIFLCGLFNVHEKVIAKEQLQAAGCFEPSSLEEFLDEKIEAGSRLGPLRLTFKRPALEHFSQFPSIFKTSSNITSLGAFKSMSRILEVPIELVLRGPVGIARKQKQNWPKIIQDQLYNLTTYMRTMPGSRIDHLRTGKETQVDDSGMITFD